MDSSTTGRAYFALFLTSIIWGTTWVVSKIGFRGIHPLYFAGLRQLIAGILFLAFFLARKKATLPTLKEWGYLLMMALLLFVISNAFAIWGIKYINSGLGAILGALFPLFVAVIDWLIGNKARPNAVSLVGLVLGLAGVAIIFFEHLGDFANPEFRFGILLSLTATFAWAIGTIITSRNLVKLNRYYALGWQMFLAGIILSIVSAVNGFTTPIAQVPMHSWMSIAYMVVFASVIAFVCFLYTLQHLPTTLAAIYAYINPIVAVILGHFVLGEGWSLSLLTGAVITLVGVYLVNSGFNRYVKKMTTSTAQE